MISYYRMKTWYKHELRLSFSNCRIELFTAYSTPTISFKISSFDDNDFEIFINFILFGFFIGFNLPKSFMVKFKESLPKYEYSRIISLSFHHYTLFWKLYVDEDRWYSNQSRLRNGSFNIIDFILGSVNSKSKIIEAKQFFLYDDTGKIGMYIEKQEITHQRKRFFTRKFNRYNVRYGYVEDVTDLSKVIYCKAKDSLVDFDYQIPKENYHCFIETPLHGATKEKYNSSITYSCSYYFKGVNSIDEAYLSAVKDVYKNKLKYSTEKYFVNESVCM